MNARIIYESTIIFNSSTDSPRQRTVQPSAGSGLFSFPNHEVLMTTSEVLSLLRAEGFENAKSHILGHGIKAGAIPRPDLNSSLQFVWSVQNVSAARRYLRNVPKPGRKKATAA